MNTTQSTSFSNLFDYIQFPLRDANWQRKLGIGMLIGLAGLIIPVLPWILIAGYAVRIAEDVIDQGDQPRLPEWTDYGGMFKDGLRIAAAMATLVLPLILVMVIGYGIIGAVIGVTASDPNSSTPAVFLTIIIQFCMAIPIMILAILTGLAMPAALSHVTAKRSYRAVFAVKEWTAIWRANMSGFLVSYLVLIVVGFALGLAMNILALTICLAPFAIGAVMMLSAVLNAALAAREYRIGRQRVWEKLGLGEPPAAPLKPHPATAADRTTATLPPVPAAPVVPAVPATPAEPPAAAEIPPAGDPGGMQTVVSYDREALLGELKEKADRIEPGLAEVSAAAAAAGMATVMARREDVLKEGLEPEVDKVKEELPVTPEMEIQAPVKAEEDLPATPELEIQAPVIEEVEKAAKKRRAKAEEKVEGEGFPPKIESVDLPAAPNDAGEMGTIIIDREGVLQTTHEAVEEPVPPADTGELPHPPAPEQAEPAPTGETSEDEGGATMIYDRDTLAGLIKKESADEKEPGNADSEKDKDA